MDHKNATHEHSNDTILRIKIDYGWNHWFRLGLNFFSSLLLFLLLSTLLFSVFINEDKVCSLIRISCLIDFKCDFYSNAYAKRVLIECFYLAAKWHTLTHTFYDHSMPIVQLKRVEWLQIDSFSISNTSIYLPHLSLYPYIAINFASHLNTTFNWTA